MGRSVGQYIGIGRGDIARSTSWEQYVPTPADLPINAMDQEVREVEDDGDGRPAQYVYSSILSAWIKQADPDSAGVAGEERSVRVFFTFASVSPVTVGIQATDELVVRSEVVITTAFDAPSPTLLLGTTSSPGVIFDTNEVKAKRMSQYQSFEIIEPPVVATPIRLAITPAGSAAGAGYVLQTYRKV